MGDRYDEAAREWLVEWGIQFRSDSGLPTRERSLAALLRDICAEDHHGPDRDRAMREPQETIDFINSDHPCCIPVGDAVNLYHGFRARCAELESEVTRLKAEIKAQHQVENLRHALALVCDACMEKLPGDATCQTERAEKAESAILPLVVALAQVATDAHALDQQGPAPDHRFAFIEGLARAALAAYEKRSKAETQPQAEATKTWKCVVCDYEAKTSHEMIAHEHDEPLALITAEAQPAPLGHKFKPNKDGAMAGDRPTRAGDTLGRGHKFLQGLGGRCVICGQYKSAHKASGSETKR